MAAQAAAGGYHLQQQAQDLPAIPGLRTASAATWSPNEKPGDREARRHDNQSALRLALLEAENRSAHSYILQLRHHIAMITAQASGQLNHINVLQEKIIALESELTSLKAKAIAAEISAGAVSERAQSSPTYNGGGGDKVSVDCSQSKLSVGVDPAPAATTKTTPRLSLSDFWADSSREDSESFKLPSNAGQRPNRGGVMKRLGPSRAALDDSRLSEAKFPAGEQETLPIAQTSTMVERMKSGGSSSTAVEEPVARTDSQDVLRLALRSATEGGEGADDRSSHMVDCCFCQSPLPEGRTFGRCDGCPRSFCTWCLKEALTEEGMDLERLDLHSSKALDGEQGDFFVERCPRCSRGCDDSFAAPPEGTAPMDHLLAELLRHDLSICFREPVDIHKHPDYLETIGRNAMMDLGTMLDKVKKKRYPRRRGPGQFLEDLNRIWRNCRRFAGCDELGRPHYGTTVPGIVRCALILEAMSTKFRDEYMSDNEGTEGWQESTWDFHRQKQERENAEARLKQLKSVATTVNKELKPPESGIVGKGATADAGRECRSSSTPATGGGEENECPAGASGKALAATKQQNTALGGRKRSAATMGGMAQHELAQSPARIMLGANGARAEVGVTTPRILSHMSGPTKQQQPPWSPLDKLCDLATAFKK